MNRMKKNELKQRENKIKNMSKEEIENFDFIESSKKDLEKFVITLQAKLFPEEHDFVYDSGVEAENRRRGKNPMREEYVTLMNHKRVKLGFEPLSEDGMAIDSSKTYEFCKKIIIGEIKYEEVVNLIQTI
jgi:hypothetical protein